ncbi:MAG: flagellar protein FlgN [Sulfuricellaceae bacterium]
MQPQRNLKQVVQAQTRSLAPAGFAENLAAEAEALQQFLQVLQAEQEALTHGNIDKLAEYARLKSEQGLRLAQLSANRNRILKQYGLESTAEGINRLIQREDPDGRRCLAQHWENLLDQAKQTQDMNRLNGAMIEAQLKHNQQALAILQEAAKQTSLYGRNGHSQALGLGRNLGKV